jgi:hypothetical protein
MAGAPGTITGAQTTRPTPVLDPRAAHVAHGHKLKTKISRSRVRESALIAVAIVEGLYLLASFFGLL